MQVCIPISTLLYSSPQMIEMTNHVPELIILIVASACRMIMLKYTLFYSTYLICILLWTSHDNYDKFRFSGTQLKRINWSKFYSRWVAHLFFAHLVPTLWWCSKWKISYQDSDKKERRQLWFVFFHSLDEETGIIVKVIRLCKHYCQDQIELCIQGLELWMCQKHYEDWVW